jgi:hypothetical protein
VTTKPIKKRWLVKIYYRTDSGLIDIEHQIEELEELQQIVERGPNWFALDHIEIRYPHSAGTETIEQLNVEGNR